MEHRVSLIILYDVEKRFLLQHRTVDAKLLPDYWAFFGGRIEQGETPDEAVKRESFEEINYKLIAPEFVMKQKFEEGEVVGYLYIYIEPFYGDKSILKLQEGQGWGWYEKSGMDSLKMVERDRQIINFISTHLEKY